VYTGAVSNPVDSKSKSEVLLFCHFDFEICFTMPNIATFSGAYLKMWQCIFGLQKKWKKTERLAKN